MSDCRDLEAMLTPYVDGEDDPAARAAVDAHLRQCPPCRDRVSTEKAARDLLQARRAGLRPCASEALRERCAAHQLGAAPVAAPAARPAARRPWVPLSLAASLLLAIGSVFFFGLNQSVELLAAQLALDHVKCFQFPPDTPEAADPVLLARQWYTQRGWPVKVPASSADYNLKLVSVRRCGSTEGITAHIMYWWHGRPLSVYVLNSASTDAGDVEQFVRRIGQDAVVWSHDGRTYAVVARASASELEPVVKYVKLNAH